MASSKISIEGESQRAALKGIATAREACHTQKSFIVQSSISAVYFFFPKMPKKLDFFSWGGNSG